MFYLQRDGTRHKDSTRLVESKGEWKANKCLLLQNQIHKEIRSDAETLLYWNCATNI